MTTTGKEKIKQQTSEELNRIAQISMDIRKAVRAALPAPPEQFFTMMVPGKVLNLEDFTAGLDANGNLTAPIAPSSVQLAEAILCDDMPALSGVQLGPTGRSVARSYGATLTKLCPAGHTVGVDDGIDPGSLDDSEKRYKAAMTWLTAPVAPDSDKTRIDLYRDKQSNYTDAFERKIKAFDDALDRATKDPVNTTVGLQRAAYDKWVSENQKMYNNLVQAAYMDWVTLGKKEEVEYYFAIVDNDSAMARVEASKEAIRNAIISDTDGSTEYNKVSLAPSNWAWLAKQKADGGQKGETVESLTWKIARLEKINLILNGMVSNPGLVNGSTPPPDSPDPAPPTDPTTGPIAEFLKALQAYQNASLDFEKAKRAGHDTADLKTNLDAKFKDLGDAREKLTTAFASVDQTNIGKLTNIATSATAALFASGAEQLNNQITANKNRIQAYRDQIKTLGSPDTVTNLQDAFAVSAGIPPAPPDLPPPNSGATSGPDFWTSISIEVSSSYNAEQTSSSSNSYSVGGGASWGLWSVGGGVSHQDATSDAAKQMANSTIKASFDCMRVDITRGWLRGELFYDDDLRVATGNFISPGPITLASLMDPETYFVSPEVAKLNREQELARYDLFPMYPTSFLLAANVVLEIDGETSDIQTHFHTSTTSGSASVGWGPFSVTSSFSHTDTQTSSTCEATATGCKITIKSPQVIGWISQIVPALPRLSQTAP
ncbi:hypothetical protein BDM02DRAFT_842383 [Thelephora ganbajun]|uniref:Uncharacterized protein n=1 Tax=Thelephora ganbajun TaxID=370292 RepID=A0ACB6Z5K4_THEGA|nr:hypothetical protein BDM02DRAFT_842383 [Thelephora ganbajun]